MKKIMCVLLALFCISSTVMAASAVEFVPTPNQVEESQTNEIIPCADEIIWKFRVNNGVVEKRRWNLTRGVWYDPYWVPA